MNACMSREHDFLYLKVLEFYSTICYCFKSCCNVSSSFLETAYKTGIKINSNLYLNMFLKNLIKLNTGWCHVWGGLSHFKAVFRILFFWNFINNYLMFFHPALFIILVQIVQFVLGFVTKYKIHLVFSCRITTVKINLNLILCFVIY